MVSFAHIHNHPLLGLQLYTLGDLYSASAGIGGEVQNKSASSGSMRDKAREAYRIARDIMLVTHGRTDSMVCSLQDNLSSR